MSHEAVRKNPKYCMKNAKITKKMSPAMKFPMTAQIGVCHLSLTSANFAGIILSNDHANHSLLTISHVAGR